MSPLVTVICLCYNHERFVREALESLVNQTYKNLEIIVVDDHSTDHSVEVIEEVVGAYPFIRFIKNPVNLGNCRSFNNAFRQSQGKFIIDFATDDVLLPGRVEKQVQAFARLDPSYGVVFGNAANIDEEGRLLDLQASETTPAPSGDIYKNILERYLISPPTMMMRREVLTALGGYDEDLSYEDFDFWVRSSRLFKYCYMNEVLTRRRITSGSLSSGFYQKKNIRMVHTTYRVIQKAMWLNRAEEENKALGRRIRYELRHAFYTESFEYVKKYRDLLRGLGEVDMLTNLISVLAALHISVYPLYRLYISGKRR